MWQDKRSMDLEILDLGADHYSANEYAHCLKLLGRINHLLGGFRTVKKALYRLKQAPQSILEVGCGGGSLCKKMADWFPLAHITGIDLNPMATTEAKKQFTPSEYPHVTITTQPDKSLNYQDSAFSVVTAMLVCHHMQDSELASFLQESYRISSSAVIINDLHRHLLAYASFSLIAPFLFPNRLIWHDGRLSIRRAFRKKDWVRILEMAGFDQKQYTLHWGFPFRWTLTLKKR